VSKPGPKNTPIGSKPVSGSPPTPITAKPVVPIPTPPTPVSSQPTSSKAPGVTPSSPSLPPSPSEGKRQPAPTEEDSAPSQPAKAVPTASTDEEDDIPSPVQQPAPSPPKVLPPKKAKTSSEQEKFDSKFKTDTDDSSEGALNPFVAKKKAKHHKHNPEVNPPSAEPNSHLKRMKKHNKAKSSKGMSDSIDPLTGKHIPTSSSDGGEDR